MSKPSLTAGWKTPWPLRFASKAELLRKLRFRTLKFRRLLGAAMQLSQYNTAELMEAAQWASYCSDDRFAQYLMEEIVERVIYGEIMESEFEESSEEAAASDGRKRETDDNICVRGEN